MTCWSISEGEEMRLREDELSEAQARLKEDELSKAKARLR